MVYTRAKIRLEGREAEVDEIERKFPDPQEIEREANRRKRLQSTPPGGSGPPPTKKQAIAPRESSKQKRGQKTLTSVVVNGDPVSNPVVSEAIGETLRSVRDQRTYQDVLQQKLNTLESKQNQNRLLLEDSLHQRVAHPAGLEIGLEDMDPQDEDERRTYRNYVRLRDLINDIRVKQAGVDANLTSCSRRLVDLMLEEYGHTISTDEDVINRMPALEEYDEASTEENGECWDPRILPAHADELALGKSAQSLGPIAEPERHPGTEIDVRNTSEISSQPAVGLQTASETAQMMNPIPDQESHHQSPEPEQYTAPDQYIQPGSEVASNSASLVADAAEAPEQLRESQLLVERARRRTREQLRWEESRFDRFWRSYKDCQQEWQRQHEAGETDDNQSAFDRAFIREGQNRTQCLVHAETTYRTAAWDAKDLRVEALSPTQTSVFPSDDGIDQAELDREHEEIENHLDRAKINAWIQEDWLHGYPSAFDGSDAQPVLKPDPGPVQDVGEGLSALPQVPYGSCQEGMALHRQRAHIDLWNDWSHADWQGMLQDWLAKSSNQQNELVPRPHRIPKPDSVRLQGSEDGKATET